MPHRATILKSLTSRYQMGIPFKKFIIFGLSIGFSMLISPLLSQKSNDIEVRGLNNELLKHAWSGGLNAPQFSNIDLNDDGIQDLFVFDRDGDRVLTFINGGQSGVVDYTYAPEYEKFFPSMTDWALLVDYNNDGKADIFTYNSAGIKVFKNTSSGGVLNFTIEVSPYLKSNSGGSVPASNIYVSRVDLPAIVDIDFDGDIDILSFGVNSNQLSYYENFAADSGDIEDFKFHDNTYCWGNFEEAPFSNKVFLNQGCPKFMVKSKGNKHAGATILAFDPDGDQDMDLLLGDPTFSNSVFLENGGSKTISNIVSQDTMFPSYSTSIDVRLFPATYYLDVNNDGLKDLIAAPNSALGVDNNKGVLFYKNTGSTSSAIFDQEEKGFLQNEMIELGSYSYPVFHDYNSDGLMDIVVGNGGVFNGPLPTIHSVSLYLNTGSASNPSFKWVDDDLAEISQINLNTSVNTPTRHVIPTFTDINSDGLMDMFIGDFQGNLHYFQNEGSSQTPDLKFTEVNYNKIDVGGYASPSFIDLDQDGLGDLVCGKQNGKLNFYKNHGSNIKAAFDTLPQQNFLGKVDTKPWYSYDGYSQAMFYRANGELYLISGSINGQLYRYGNISGNLNGDFTLLDTIFEGIDVGDRSHAAMADINNDGMFELVIGNGAGGLNLYYTDKLVGFKDVAGKGKDELEISINQLENFLYRITSNSEKSGSISLYNTVGSLLYKDSFSNYKDLNLNNYSNGVYLINVSIESNSITKKLILAK